MVIEALSTLAGTVLLPLTGMRSRNGLHQVPITLEPRTFPFFDSRLRGSGSSSQRSTSPPRGRRTPNSRPGVVLETAALSREYTPELTSICPNSPLSGPKVTSLATSRKLTNSSIESVILTGLESRWPHSGVTLYSLGAIPCDHIVNSITTECDLQKREDKVSPMDRLGC